MISAIIRWAVPIAYQCGAIEPACAEPAGPTGAPPDDAGGASSVELTVAHLQALRRDHTG